MNEETPELYPFLGFLRFTGNKRWDFIILGIVVLLIFGLFIYLMFTRGIGNANIQFNPSDVVYGEKIHAVHSMETSPYSQPSSLSLVSLPIKPEMQLSETYYDFGVVDAQQVLTRTFVITNSGQSPLIILRAYTTCGCTTADFTTTEIPSGKVGLMVLQFDPGYHDMHGTTVRRGVMIETNDPDHLTQEVWIQASIK
jgi:hypothetical protein